MPHADYLQKVNSLGEEGQTKKRWDEACKHNDHGTPAVDACEAVTVPSRLAGCILIFFFNERA